MPQEDSGTITLKQFLEEVPPGELRGVSDLATTVHNPTGPDFTHFSAPELLLHCENQACAGPRLFSTKRSVNIPRGKSEVFTTYVCKNCGKQTKTFALFQAFDGGTKGSVFKYGELPLFGPPTPSKLITLIGPDRDLFLKGGAPRIKVLASRPSLITAA